MRIRNKHDLHNKRTSYWVCACCHSIFTRRAKVCMCTSKLIHLASKAELARFKELILLQQAGEISDLKIKARYPLALFDRNGQPVAKSPVYECDFAYRENGVTVVEDVKSTGKKGDTQLFSFKARLFAAVYGFAVSVVRR